MPVLYELHLFSECEVVAKASSEHVAEALIKASSVALKKEPSITPQAKTSEKLIDTPKKVSSQAKSSESTAAASQASLKGKKSSKDSALNPPEDGIANSRLKKEPSAKQVLSKKSIGSGNSLDIGGKCGGASMMNIQNQTVQSEPSLAGSQCEVAEVVQKRSSVVKSKQSLASNKSIEGAKKVSSKALAPSDSVKEALPAKTSSVKVTKTPSSSSSRKIPSKKSLTKSQESSSAVEKKSSKGLAAPTAEKVCMI